MTNANASQTHLGTQITDDSKSSLYFEEPDYHTQQAHTPQYKVLQGRHVSQANTARKDDTSVVSAAIVAGTVAVAVGAGSALMAGVLALAAGGALFIG
ncbi:hypothetical protein BZA77DRAFT_355864 [Pyronema omphalodes]|nr:hypothetical protein BZA77DRAFT_355864 [Pyronema omphalodes]